MKKIFLFAAAMLSVCFFASCVDIGITAPGESEFYSYDSEQPSFEPILSSVESSSSEIFVSVPSEIHSTEYGSTSAYVEPSVAETSSEAPSETSPEIPSTEPPETVPVSESPSTQPPATREEPSSVDLSIELPEANGEMVVDKSPSNKLIRSVVSKKKIDADCLVAVFSVPESGQNYVLEFTDKSNRTKNTLRRVYLLDADGKIKSVAAANSREKENISSTENWFCFNVLVKGVIFDAIEGKMN